MPANGPFLILMTAAAIALLLFVILVLKLHPFLALMISSMALGLAAGMPPEKVLKSIQSGFGEALGFIAVVVGLGAMIGRFLEHSGGGRVLADWLLEKFGRERAVWAILIAAFLVGLPLFFEVGFVILAPLVWNLARETKRSVLFYGLPMAAALTTTHSMVAPHPAPAAAAQLFGADLGLSILYGIAVSVPMAIVGGILYGGWVSKRMNIAVPAISEAAPKTNETQGPPPSLPVIVLLLLLPVLLIFGATLASFYKLPYGGAATFLGHPFSALTITALVAIYWLGLRRGVTRENAGKMAAQSLAPMGALLCIMGGGGAFKQIIVDSGVGQYAGHLLMTSSISPLLVAWVIAVAMRIAQGSATVAIITAAGIVAPIVKGIPGYSPNLIMLALCCGGSGFSHVSDSGFWLVNQYFGMTVAQTLKSWTAMKVIESVVGLGIVLAIQALVR
ncbi:MAG TPA: gluconate:H+ symporter [Bryobacteraceae bacterium]|nr:gluconate:H+ symporter [Bryobacteraceae bacterium]